MASYWSTIWVCENCMLHSVNGECGDCHSDGGHSFEPWRNWEGEECLQFTMGMRSEKHSCDGDYEECDCEKDTFSTMSCEGCGDRHHGSRYAFTVWDDGEYKVIRFYQKGGRRVLKKGLTLTEARAHCNNPETSSRTCTSAAGKRRTERMGVWFDGFDRM